MLSSTNELVEDSTSMSVFERKRAKSYPSERPTEPIPLLELPKHSQEDESESGVS